MDWARFAGWTNDGVRRRRSARRSRRRGRGRQAPSAGAAGRTAGASVRSARGEARTPGPDSSRSGTSDVQLPADACRSSGDGRIGRMWCFWAHAPTHLEPRASPGPEASLVPVSLEPPRPPQLARWRTDRHDDDRVAAGIPSLPQGRKRRAARDRIVRFQAFRRRGKHRPVGSSVRDQDQRAIESAISKLEHHASIDGLDIADAGFDVHADAASTSQDAVPGPKVARDRDRHLARPAPWRDDQGDEAFHRRGLSIVAETATCRVGP